MDWSDGQYELTAETLRTASTRAVDVAKIERGARVIDLGTGTGNAAIEAAKRGAEVVAIDPAERLLGVCRARAAHEGLSITTKRGDAGAIPAADASADALVSVFAVIFAPDAERAAREMLRVVRPGGRIVLTSWLPTGPISQAGKIIRDAMARLGPKHDDRPAPAWGDRGWVERLFGEHGARATIEDARLHFEAASPDAWFDEQIEHHPVWRFVHGALRDAPDEWSRVRAESLAALRDGNEDPTRMRVTSHYMVIDIVRPE